MNRLIYPITMMQLESPQKFFIDVPIDVWPGQELRRIEVPRELARYIDELQKTVADLRRQADKAGGGDE